MFRNKATVIVGALMIIGAVFCGAEAAVIYAENFNTDPNYTTVGQRVGDIMGWDTSTQSYRVYWPNDGHMIYDYALSPKFSPVSSGDSFRFSIDMMINSMTWGHHMHVGLGESYSGNQLSMGANWDGSYSVGDGATGYTLIPSMEYNAWYSFLINYDSSSQTATISAWNRSTGSLVNQLTNVAFLPVAFDQIYFGNHLMFSEGETAEMYFDNVRLDANAVPEPDTALLLVAGIAGLAGRKIRKRY